ncbi:MAG: hypothetical protein IKJ45_17500 [Kiritimatiellae bacterium]|nr:hypothetical protein [Kiritimatiellia bacterium]
MKRLTYKMLMEAVQVSLGAIYKNEYRLIKQHCHELNIVGTFYYYFRKLFQEQFSPFCIDMEYSRMGKQMDPKEIDIQNLRGKCPYCHKKHRRRIRSDFIIHTPGADNNLLVIEFKGMWSSGCLEWDEKKLCALTKSLVARPAGESYVCGYKLGVSIIMHEDGCQLQLFVKGKKCGQRFLIPKKCLIGKY